MQYNPFITLGELYERAKKHYKENQSWRQLVATIDKREKLEYAHNSKLESFVKGLTKLEKNSTLLIDGQPTAYLFSSTIARLREISGWMSPNNDEEGLKIFKQTIHELKLRGKKYAN